MTKDFLQITDFTTEEIYETFDIAGELKVGESIYEGILKGKTVACIFTKPSLRTRISFETGIYELGGYSLYVTDKEIQLGVRESIYDAAKVLSRFVSMIMIRTFDHSDVEQLAEHADVPVINGLTDLTHPCQVMGDMLTAKEHLGRLENLKVAFLGDGNNVFNSWMNLACRIPMELRLGTSPKTLPDQKILKKTEEAGKSKVIVTHDAAEAVSGVDVIYTDVWASMGQKEKAKEKAELLKDFQVNDELLAKADPSCIVMHCLPANRGEEITDSVMDGKHSVVFDEAENRLHIQKAIMVQLMRNHLG
ncbi:MAG: ornithine carbamoyltransferase [candidate division Zixibacteria bacterium]|nr:ornithine carbamoyltransferase [candidate division Zixibacteria bacterium]